MYTTLRSPYNVYYSRTIQFIYPSTPPHPFPRSRIVLAQLIIWVVVAYFTSALARPYHCTLSCSAVVAVIYCFPSSLVGVAYRPCPHVARQSNYMTHDYSVASQNICAYKYSLPKIYQLITPNIILMSGPLNPFIIYQFSYSVTNRSVLEVLGKKKLMTILYEKRKGYIFRV